MKIFVLLLCSFAGLQAQLITNNSGGSGGGCVGCSLLYGTYPTFGWVQSTVPSVLSTNAYLYRASLPTYSYSPNTYSTLWFDINSFPTGSLLGSTANGLSNVTDAFRWSGTSTAGKYQLSSFYLNAATTSINQYIQTSASADGIAAIYAGNDHVSGCSGVPCDGNNFTDHDPALIIGREIDVECRNSSSRCFGAYIALVNSISSPTSAAVLTDANQSLQHGFAAFQPWGASFKTSPGASLVGLWVTPSSITGPADSPPNRLCSYTDAAPTSECMSDTYTQNGVALNLTPGNKRLFTGGAGTNLSAVWSQYFRDIKTADFSITATQTGQYYTNTGAAGAINGTLPATPIAGEWILFTVEAAQTLNVLGAGNGFRDGRVTGTTISSNTIGSSLYIVASSASVWEVVFKTGNWTMNSTQLGVNGPLPSRTAGTTTASINATATQFQLGCVPIWAANFNATGRGFNYKAYGTTTSVITDSPAYNFRLTLYTDSGCTTGATDLTTTSNYTATVNALTAAPWQVETEVIYAAGTNNWVIGGTSAAVTNAGALPGIRQFSAATSTAFDPSTCTGGICGLSLRVTAASGTVAGTPTVTRNFDFFQYR